jgi:hypothetical protein
MDVGMVHGLPAFEAGIGHQSMAGGIDALLARHLCGQREHLASQARIGLGDGRDMGMVVHWDDKHVHGSLGLDIAECDRTIRAGDDIGGYVTGRNPAEEAVGHADILA